MALVPLFKRLMKVIKKNLEDCSKRERANDIGLIDVLKLLVYIYRKNAFSEES